MKKRFLMPEAYWDTALLERWLEEKAVQAGGRCRFLAMAAESLSRRSQEAPVSAGAPADRDL